MNLIKLPTSTPALNPASNSTQPAPAVEIKLPGPVSNVLASDVEVTGTLMFTGHLILDGKLHGEILSDGHLVVGKNAHIQGDVQTKTVAVHGTVTGNISVADRCELKASGTLVGDLKASRILIEEGATFIGKSEVTMHRPGPRPDAVRAPQPELSDKR